MRRRSFQDQIQAAAYHEAGHAVMCYLMHLRITSVSIGNDGLHNGEMTHENPFRGVDRARDDSFGARLRIEKIIMLCLAGPLAQQKSAPGALSRDYGGAMDEDTASSLAMQFFHSRKTARAYVYFARAWVRQKLDEPAIWAAVERLASVLMKQRKISGRQAEAIIRSRYLRPRGQSGRSARRRATA